MCYVEDGIWVSASCFEAVHDVVVLQVWQGCSSGLILWQSQRKMKCHGRCWSLRYLLQLWSSIPQSSLSFMMHRHRLQTLQYMRYVSKPGFWSVPYLFILLNFFIVLSSWNCLCFLRLGFLMVSSNPAVFVALLMGKRTPIECIFFIVPPFMTVPNFEYCFTKGFSWWGIWWTGWWWDSSNDQGTAGDTDSTCCPRWWWWYWIQELWCVSV